MEVFSQNRIGLRLVSKRVITAINQRTFYLQILRAAVLHVMDSQSDVQSAAVNPYFVRSKQTAPTRLLEAR